MSAQIIHFKLPAPRQQETLESPGAYDFWYWLIELLPSEQRKMTVERAQRCGVIDESDAEIFMASWPGVPDFWSGSG